MVYTAKEASTINNMERSKELYGHKCSWIKTKRSSITQ